jgi:hypothetical protein
MSLRKVCVRSAAFLIVVMLLAVVSPLAAQKHRRDFLSKPPVASSDKMIRTLPFSPSEQLVYEVEFSRSLLRGINIAEFRFVVAERNALSTTKTKSSANELKVKLAPQLVFTCEAVSKGFFQKLFGLDFRFAVESMVAPETFAVEISRKHDEQGKRLRKSEAVFDYKTRRLVWTERDPNSPAKEPRIVETPFGDVGGAIQDLASVIYFLRTQPLTQGASYDLALSDSGRIYRVPVRVVGTKRIDSPSGKVAATELNVEIFGKDRLVEERGEMSLWFANDARRTPLRARIKSEMGTVTIKLKSQGGKSKQESIKRVYGR